jgi:hypothetical protein
MKYSQLAVLALIGDKVAVKTVQALKARNHDLVGEDYFDRSYNENEQVAAQKPPVNKFDGLIHAQNGKVYDPQSLKEVDINEDSAAVQTGDWYDDDFEEKNTWTGEPIATV